MTDEEIKSYYGAVDCENIKMLSLDRKIYPYRKIPVYKAEDFLYAMQNVAARNITAGYDNTFDGSVFLLPRKYGLETDLSILTNLLSGYVENLISTYEWLKPDIELKTNEFIEFDSSVFLDYLKEQNLVLDRSDFSERPNLHIEQGVSVFHLAKRIEWINRSFEKMMVRFEDDMHFIRLKYGLLPLGFSSRYRYSSWPDPPLDPFPEEYRDYIGEEHTHMSGHHGNHTTTDSETIKIKALDLNDRSTKYVDKIELDLEGIQGKYYGDWIDEFHFVLTFRATYSNSSEDYSNPWSHNYETRFFFITKDATLDVSTIKNALQYAKEKLGYEPDVTDETKSLGLVAHLPEAIIKLKKEKLTIIEEQEES